MLPGTLLLLVGSVDVPGLTDSVVLLAEPGDAPGLPADKANLEEAVRQQVSDALARPEVTINTPGRFTFHRPA